jgi:hypothetical protein
MGRRADDDLNERGADHHNVDVDDDNVDDYNDQHVVNEHVVNDLDEHLEHVHQHLHVAHQRQELRRRRHVRHELPERDDSELCHHRRIGCLRLGRDRDELQDRDADLHGR